MTVCKYCQTDSATLSWQAARIDMLEEQLRQASAKKEQDIDRIVRDGAVKLTKSEQAIVALLLLRERPMTSAELYLALPAQAPGGDKVVGVFICHLRKKLAPLGLEIRNLQHGYYIPRDQKGAALATFTRDARAS